LKKDGFKHVKSFENGLDAFDHINTLVSQAKSENKPISDFINLVITDIEMPKMDGLTLCRHIKKDLGLSEIPVALFSSLIDEQMTVKCKEAGADVFTSKPQIGELIVLIDDLLHVKSFNLATIHNFTHSQLCF
jgi:two-component system chemotaxis response regulator CheV